MGIKKVVIDGNTQVPMEYHIVAFSNVQWLNNAVILTICSFYNQDAYTKGSRNLDQRQVQIAGLPPKGTDFMDWAQERLILTPTDAPDEVNLLDRFYLGGGEVLDYAPGVVPAAVVETPPVVEDPAPAVVADPAPTAAQ